MPGRSVLARASAEPRARLAAIAALTLLAAAGCGGEADAPGGAAASPAPAAATPNPTEPTGAPLRYADGRVSVSRDQVLQLALLEELAARAGFELEVGEVTPKSLTLRLADAPLLDAIATILEGTPFRAEYAVDPTTGEHRLAKLGVGNPTARPATADAGAPGADREERARRFSSDRMRELMAQRREGSEDRSRDVTAALEERRAREAAALEQLATGDAQRRADALEVIDPSGDALARISELARTDPDPRVRAVAVERLGDADTYQATTVLLDSLSDPAPQVVISALAALEFMGDASLLPRIEPFANHPDPAVREAAREAIEGLQ